MGGLKKEPATRRKTGTTIRWKPDAEVFTDVNVPAEYFADTMKRQAVVNAGLELVLDTLIIFLLFRTGIFQRMGLWRPKASKQN